MTLSLVHRLTNSKFARPVSGESAFLPKEYLRLIEHRDPCFLKPVFTDDIAHTAPTTERPGTEIEKRGQQG